MVNGVPVTINAADDALAWSYCYTECEHKINSNISCWPLD